MLLELLELLFVVHLLLPVFVPFSSFSSLQEVFTVHLRLARKTLDQVRDVLDNRSDD